MKLPQYDNRPAAGTPLYSEPDAPPFETIKFVGLSIGLPSAVVACIGLFVVGVIALFN